MSNTKIKDIDQQYIAGKMTKKDVTKISRQLDHSMGNFMAYFRVACVILAAILIYLLTKTIVERNRRSISIVKILGYYDREITSLYMTVTTTSERTAWRKRIPGTGIYGSRRSECHQQYPSSEVRR